MWRLICNPPGYHSLGYIYRPPMKLWEGNVFTCVCLFTGGLGSPYDHYPWCIRPHCTGPPTKALPHPPDIRHGSPCPSLLATFGGHHSGPAQICSFEDPSPPVLTSGDRNMYSWQACFLVNFTFIGAQIFRLSQKCQVSSGRRVSV